MTAAEPNALAYACATWWCREPRCRGEHHADIGEPVSATAHTPRPSQFGEFWALGREGQHWLEHRRSPAAVRLATHRRRRSRQADLHIHEAKLLVETLQHAILSSKGTGRDVAAIARPLATIVPADVWGGRRQHRLEAVGYPPNGAAGR